MHLAGLEIVMILLYSYQKIGILRLLINCIEMDSNFACGDFHEEKLKLEKGLHKKLDTLFILVDLYYSV
ncbi:MAG: hypothetical protein ACREAG_04635 [Nitrosopumilaceae archaeon]